MSPALRTLCLLGTAAIAACSSPPYVPEAYEIKGEPPPAVSTSGTVTVQNVQSDHTVRAAEGYQPPALVDLAIVTDALASQLAKAIGPGSAGPAKSIKVRVLDLGTDVPAGISAYHVSWLDVSVSLGDGMPMVLQSVTRTGDFSVASWRAYDYVTAQAVRDILANRDVQAYLSQAGTNPPKPTAPAIDTRAVKPNAPATAEPASKEPAKGDATARLKELKSMLDQGLITQEQYDKKRQEILDSM